MGSLATREVRGKPSQRWRHSDRRIRHRFCSCGCAIIEVRAYGGRLLGYRDAASNRQISRCPGCGDTIRNFELLDYEPKAVIWPCPECGRPLADLRDVEDARRYGGCNDCYREPEKGQVAA